MRVEVVDRHFDVLSLLQFVEGVDEEVKVKSICRSKYISR